MVTVLQKVDTELCQMLEAQDLHITLREANFFDEKDLFGIWSVCRQLLRKYRIVAFADFKEFCRGWWLDNPWRTPHHKFGWVKELPGGEIGGFLGCMPMRMQIQDLEITTLGPHSWAALPAARHTPQSLYKQLVTLGDGNFLLITPGSRYFDDIHNRLPLGFNKIPIQTINQHFFWVPKPEEIVQWVIRIKVHETIAKGCAIFPLKPIILALSRSTFYRNRFLHIPVRQIKVEQVSVLGDEFDQLWKRIRGQYPITAVRDRLTLQWRHLSLPNIIGETSILVCRLQDELQGYVAVQRKSEAAGFAPGYFVVTDIFYDRKHPDVLPNLINGAFEFAIDRGCTIFQFVNMSKELREVLQTQRPYVRTLQFCPYWYKAPTEKLATSCNNEWWPSGLDGEMSL